MDPIEIGKLLLPALALGGAWGGAKAALNGTRERVKKLETRVDLNAARLVALGEALARIETKQDILLSHVERK